MTPGTQKSSITCRLIHARGTRDHYYQKMARSDCAEFEAETKHELHCDASAPFENRCKILLGGKFQVVLFTLNHGSYVLKVTRNACPNGLVVALKMTEILELLSP